jgi:hypothetical protein
VPEICASPIRRRRGSAEILRRIDKPAKRRQDIVDALHPMTQSAKKRWTFACNAVYFVL